MEKTAIDIKNLSFSYGKKQILNNINATFPANAFSVVLGINGSGKSTLMRILAGLIKNYTGEISFFGQEVGSMNALQKAYTIGFLSQDFQSVFPLSAEDIMLTGRGAFSRLNFSKEDKQKVLEVAKQLDLEPLLQEPFNVLSGGQQQRVLIGRILVQNPKIIILDEPTNHLDIYHKHQLLSYLTTLSKAGFTIIAVMHDPTIAFQYADHIYYIQNSGITKAVLSEPQDLQPLKEIFNIDFVSLDQDGQKFIVSKGRLY